VGTAKQKRESAAHMKAIRKALKLTQVEMATKLDVHVSTVCKWEQGRAIPHRMFRARVEALPS